MKNTDRHRPTRTLLAAALVLVCVFGAGAQAIRIDADDAGVASEDAFQATQTANADQETARVVAFAEAIQSSDYGLLLHSVIAAPGRIRTYLAPIRYDDNGTPKPIDLRWKNVSGINPNYAYACLTNDVITGLDTSGWKHLKGRGFHFKTRPAGIVIGQNTIATNQIEFPVRRVNATRLRVDGLWPANIPSFYQIQAAGVKEALLLPAPLQAQIPAQAETIRFRYAYERITGTHTAQLSTDHSAIYILNAGRVVGLLPRPWAQDTAGDRIYGSYGLGSGFFDIILDAAWLRSAQFPILVDPTATAAVSTQNIIADSSSDDDPYHAYFQVDLPDIGSGATFDTADWHAYMQTDTGIPVTIEIWTSASTAWNGSSNYATLSGLTTFDSNVGITFSGVGSNTWKTWTDIHGTTANAQTIATAYDGETNPGAWTIIMHSSLGTGDTAPWTGLPDLYFSVDDDADYVDFSNVGDVNEPYIEITYEGGAGASGDSVGGGTVGLIGG